MPEGQISLKLIGCLAVLEAATLFLAILIHTEAENSGLTDKAEQRALRLTCFSIIVMVWPSGISRSVLQKT